MNEVRLEPTRGSRYLDAALADGVSSDAPSRYQTLSGLLGVLKQRWKTVLLIAIATFGLGTLAYYAIASYVATTTIEVNKDDPTDSGAGQMNGAALTADDVKNEVQTNVSILQTDDDLALDVIGTLNLVDDPSFQKAVVFSERGRPLAQAPLTSKNALAIFRSKLKIDSPADTRLITISYKNPDPTLAANVTNQLAKAFIDHTVLRRQRSIHTSSILLQGELDELKARMEKSEQALADYERNTGLAGIELTGASSGNGNTTVSVTPQNTVTSRLLTLNQELAAAESNRIASEAVYRLIRSQDPEAVLGLGPMNIANGNGGGAGSVSPESVALVSTLRAQEADLERQLASSDVKYGENNPRHIQLQQQANSVKQELQAELGRVRSRAAADYHYAQANEEAIRAEFKKQQDAANDMADKSVKLQLLAQEAFSNRALYEGLYSKLQNAALASSARASRINIVSAAIPAVTPQWPKRSLYLAGLAAVALFLGVTAAFLAESLDETVRTSDDMAELQGLTAVGYIPRLSNDSPWKAVSKGRIRISLSGNNASMRNDVSNRYQGDSIRRGLIDSPRSPFSEAFRALRTSMNLVLGPSGSRTIMVTSALGGSGKTTVTYNLGVAFAQQGARVLLIDGDIRNPDLHRLFGIPIAPGLSDACRNPQAPENAGIVQHPSISSLFMIPAGERIDFPSELFGSAAFESLLQKAASLYDYILIDSPPILAVTDASIIASKVRAVIAVVRSRNTTRNALHALIQALHRSQAPLVTFVLNDVRYPTRDGFYHYNYSRQKGEPVDASA
jgi:capsular exopolysaccharide synthesis family protein